MAEEITICPYTGLRPFTEEESLYFKGRDEHIDQATRQLERNRFIMLTGASGDGKSSLVYAGIIPNAKAGFLKSQFSNWAVVDFRPERNPLGNLSHALAGQLGIAQESTVRTELGHGFSALVDMYKASALYADVSDSEWQALEESQKTIRKRRAANLIIIADQFEEFFTNPENFHKGVASQEASLVTNLLLETARLALEEQLPIYVIITMRSDFIGQCASFRGLPEAIGFSQFFVPRLNRAQLQEVIEEPAVLSGNRISRRLTERLIHDMVEGTDQLPILQHALNQIWKMADEGKAEMDLLHYAMVGGMRGQDLPGEETIRFQQWFNHLPPKIQACYDQPDLQNVLNTHANKLSSFATEYLREQYQVQIPEEQTRIVIEATFKCLTKIDNGRAVRNRMTLGEITAILHIPELGADQVGKVLNIFREPGNTLLRPYLEEVPELLQNSVLDITHESLIRNWENLDAWARQEYASYTTFLDFSQQLNRWVESGKSNAFLLYIGPLTYFENWFDKVKPNAGWIARYLGEDLDHDQKILRASDILDNANEFLLRSARKHIITRTVMKYGARKMVAALGLIALVTLCSFAITGYLSRRNSAVLDRIKEESITLINNPKLTFGQRADLILAEARLKMITVNEAVGKVNAPLEKIKIADGIAEVLFTRGRTGPAREVAEALAITDSLFEIYPAKDQNTKQLSLYLNELNEWRVTLGVGYFYRPSEYLLKLQARNGRRSAVSILNILKSQRPDFTDFLSFSILLETAVNFNAFRPEELTYVLATLSPFEGRPGEWVKTHFRKNELVTRGYQGYGFNFNGLYQNLACLYAAAGQPDKALQAIDTLLKYNEPYYQRDYTNMLDNATNVASTFYRNHQEDKLAVFVSGYCARKKMTEIDFYRRLLGRMKPYQLTRNGRYITFWEESENLNLQYGDPGEVRFFYSRYREVVMRSKSPDEQHFLLAVSYKDEGLTIAHHDEVGGGTYDRQAVFELYARGLTEYRKVSESYLRENIERVGAALSDEIVTPRNSIFLYPDLITPFTPLGPRDFHWSYLSASFIDYLLENNLVAQLYGGPQELKYFEEWFHNYHYSVWAGEILLRNHVSFELLARLEKSLKAQGAPAKIDLNLLYLYLGHYAMEANDQSVALPYYNQLKPENFTNILRYKTLNGYANGNSLMLIGEAFVCFTRNNKPDAGKALLSFFKNPVNRSSVYAFAARELMEVNGETGKVRELLDSAKAEMGRVENFNSIQPNRFLIAIGLVMNHPDDQSVAEARNVIRNNALKLEGLERIARALSYREELFKATQLMPENLSAEDRADLLWDILHGYASRQPVEKEWQEFVKNIGFGNKTNRILYVDESN